MDGWIDVFLSQIRIAASVNRIDPNIRELDILHFHDIFFITHPVGKKKTFRFRLRKNKKMEFNPVLEHKVPVQTCVCV